MLQKQHCCVGKVAVWDPMATEGTENLTEHMRKLNCVACCDYGSSEKLLHV